jgi:two-component system sensor histidine kinase DesK
MANESSPACNGRPHLLAAVWLVYLVAIPINLVQDHAQPSRWAFELGGMAAFLVLWFSIFRLKEWRALGPIAGMFALGAIFMPSDPAALVYVVFGATFFGWSFRSMATAYRLLIFYVAAIGLVAWATHLPGETWISALAASALIGFVQVHFGREHREAVRLRLAYDEVERLTKVAERERIARDLHDVLGHTLSLIVLKSELASKLAEIDPARAAAEIRDVERIARDSLADVRSALAGYRGAGIAAEIDHARDVFATAGIALECDAADLRLPVQHEGVLALAIREAVTNVVRHADARTVRLVLRAENGRCRFEIVDDGKGGGPDGAGLTGMRERVESLGGVLERSREGGTRLIVSLPLGAAS